VVLRLILDIMIKRLIDSQRWLSSKFDGLLALEYRIDGNSHFLQSFLPSYIKSGLRIYDIGGGKNPYLSVEKKKELNAVVVGFDIDDGELKKAPRGAYDEIVCGDITNYEGRGDADLAICQALLEHVKDTEKAFAAIASILKPGGVAVVFVPSKNALYAKVNTMASEKVRRWLLDITYPAATKANHGFAAYYDRCSPAEFRQLAKNNNLSIIEERFYYYSWYLSFCFPAHVLWRLWILLFRFLKKEQAAESFSMVMRKRE